MGKTLSVSIGLMSEDVVSVLIMEPESGDHVSRFFRNTPHVTQDFKDWIAEKIWSWKGDAE